MQIIKTIHTVFGVENGHKWLITMIFIALQSLSFYNSSSIYAQLKSEDVHSTRKITGIVKDKKGDALIGVSVTIKNYSKIGTITDLNGKFSIVLPSNSNTIICSYIGYKQLECLVNKSPLNIEMEEIATDIDEVVVVGYGNQKKTTVTGSVAVISTKDLLQSPQANVGNALVGRISGISEIQKSGEPGKDQSTIRIRGIGSFATSGSTDLQAPLIMIDGIESSSFNNLDANEIENISVLKDASATAVYGVRGANGVVLVTTKRGSISKPQVNLSMNYATQNFTNFRKEMNAYDWARSFNEAISYDGYITGNYTPKYTNEELEKFKNHSDPIFYPDTDWISLIFKDHTTQTQYNVNVNGGSEKVKYFVSLGYFTQDGMFNNTNLLNGYDTQIRFKRYNLRTNLDFKVTKDLSISFNISDQVTDRHSPDATTENLLSDAYSHPPTSGPGLVDDKIINNLPGRFNFTLNPLISLSQGGGNIVEYQNQLNGSVRANLNLGFITKGLSSRATISYQSFNSHTIRYTKNVVTYNAVRNPDTNEAIFLPQGQESAFGVNDYFGKNRKVYLEAGLDYSRNFEKHNIGGLLLYNQSKYYSPTLEYLVPNGYQGVVGRFTYDYNNRYLAEFNVGYNGTENFAAGKRFGLFPAFSIGWTVSEEKFFQKSDLISYLKIRGSYGQVGNDKIGGERFLYMPTAYLYYSGTSPSSNDRNPQYNLGTVGVNYSNYKVSAEGKAGNPDLTWERSEKSNIGIDTYLWKDKIKITADLFKEYRSNILTNRGTIPVIIGADMPAYNLGIMKNGGFDGDITYRDHFKNFNYWLKGTYTFAHNKIIYKDEVTHQYPYLNGTGQRFNQYFGFIAEGFYNSWEEVNDVNRPVYVYNNNKIQPGDVKYKDINGDGKINEMDIVPIGYSNFPEISYGISLGAEYKGFDFSVLFQGADNVSTSISTRNNRGFMEDGAAVDYLKDYSWTKERYELGSEIYFPHLSASSSQTSNYMSSTLWVRNASYLRLKNAEFGYTITGKITKKIGFQTVRFYVNGNNLITWSELLKSFPYIDPELQTTSGEPYPIIRTINFGLNIKF